MHGHALPHAHIAARKSDQQTCRSSIHMNYQRPTMNIHMLISAYNYFAELCRAEPLEYDVCPTLDFVTWPHFCARDETQI